MSTPPAPGSPFQGLPAAVRVALATPDANGRLSILSDALGGGTSAPAFTAQPSITPASGNTGQTFTASPGTVSNGSITSRQWLLNGTSISSGLTAVPGVAGTLTYQETATGAGGTTLSALQSVTVSAVAPTLAPLTVSNNAGTVGTPYTATISGKTAGSTIAPSGPGAAGLTVSGTTLSGTPTAAGAVDLVETLAGATGSPRTSSGVLTIAAGAGPAVDTLVAWTPSMLNLNALYSVENQASVKDTGGATAAAGTAIETWQDQTANARHAISAANAAAASTTATRPVVGASETLGSFTGSPIRFNNGVRTHRLLTPASTFGMASGSEGDKLFVLARIRDGAAAAQRTLLGNSAGNFNVNVATSDSTAPGLVYTGSVAGAIKTDTTTRIDMIVQQKDVNSGNAYVGRLNGSETAGATGTGGSLPATTRLSIGNVYGGSQGSDCDVFVVAVIPAGTSRTNIQRLEGYYAHLFGLTAQLAAGHPFKTTPPRVPQGTTSTQAWVDANFASGAARQTWAGPQVELQADSFNSSTTTVAIDDQNDVWGFPYSLTSAEQARVKSEWFPGNGKGYMFLRFPLGFCYRGLRNIDGTSGLAKNLSERYAGQNTAIGNMLANVAPVGGGLFAEYWTPAPHWKTNGALTGGAGRPTNGVVPATLHAGGSYARSVTLDSIRTSDPTQYNAQIAAFTDAIIGDLEYLHANVSRVCGFALQNEAVNPTDANYGTCTYPSDYVLYTHVLEALVPKIRASTALATYGGQPNSVRINAASWQAIPAVLLNSSIYPEIDHNSVHYITSLGADADYAKSNMASWFTSSGGKAIGQNEFEYFSLSAPNDDPARRFANTALVQAHFVNLGRAPTTNPMIHLFKQLGQTGTDGSTEGYAVLAARLPAPFNQAPSTPGDPYPALGHGEYFAQGFNANAVRAFADNMLAGSTVFPHSLAQNVAGTQAVAWKTPAGKAGVAIVNRTASPLAIPLGLSGQRTVRVWRYDKDAARAEVDYRTSTALSLSVPANSVYVVEEQ